MTRLRSLPGRLGTVAPRLRTDTTGAGTGFARTDGRSSSARGYGSDWRKVRAQVLAREPYCRTCRDAGRMTTATEVDHIERFQGLDDPKRLDPRNLRPLCTPCHRARTARQARGTD